jgi:hypothetical protein
MHPLLAHNVDEDVWTCRSNHVCLDEYQVVSKPITNTGTPHIFPMIRHMYTWLRRKNIIIHKPCCGLVNTKSKTIYSVDILAERNDKIVLVLFHYTDKRGGDAQRIMVEHLESVLSQCKTHCKVKAIGLVINIYGEGKVVGKFIE